MRTIKHPIHGIMIRIEDLKASDIIMVRRRINSKKVPYWPFKIRSSIPRNNAHGFAVLTGEFLLPEGNEAPGRYSPTARVMEHTDNEYYVVGKPMSDKWANKELKKVNESIDELTCKRNWLENLNKGIV